MVDSAPEPMSEIQRRRLERLTHACLIGDAAGTELALHQWQRQSNCPLQARLLLAALLAVRGQVATARHILRHAVKPSPEPARAATIAMFVSLLVSEGLLDAAAAYSHHLASIAADRPDLLTWLGELELPGCEDLPTPTDVDAAQLAQELANNLGVIPSLVFALKHQTDARAVALLRGAIARLPEPIIEQRYVTICQSRAELAILANDSSDARRWAHRGLARDPYAAPLALLLADLDDEPSLGPPAQQILARVSDHWPSYPDLRAAWIRRQFRDGQSHQARKHLARWLAHDPNAPLARELEQELAA